MSETLSKVFIDVEVDDSVAADAALAKKLEEVCPVDIFKATECAGRDRRRQPRRVRPLQPLRRRRARRARCASSSCTSSSRRPLRASASSRSRSGITTIPRSASSGGAVALDLDPVLAAFADDQGGDRVDRRARDQAEVAD